MNLKPFFLFLLLLISGQQMQAQISGCPDSKALNYNAAATINDGSCLYPYTSVTPVQRCLLPNLLLESSGLVMHHGKLFSNADSGNPNTFYRIDTLTGAILQKISTTNGSNNDWEELSGDSTFVYIGDFGNNNGDRTNLKIYKMNWNQIGTANTITNTVQAIAFYYPDQTDFTPHSNANRFDCEAMICRGDSIYLFSKDWVNYHTRVYAVSKQAGNHAATYLDSFDVGGLITGASYDSLQNKLVLIGYTKAGLSFLWELTDFKGVQFFKGNKRRIELGFVGQTEGVAILDSHRIVISNEGKSVIHQKLSIVDDRNWQVVNGLRAVKKKMWKAGSIFPNPCRVSFRCMAKPPQALMQLVDAMGRVCISSYSDEVNVAAIPNGTYLVLIDGALIDKVLVAH
jgi:hypothetical protein